MYYKWYDSYELRAVRVTTSVQLVKCISLVRITSEKVESSFFVHDPYESYHLQYTPSATNEPKHAKHSVHSSFLKCDGPNTLNIAYILRSKNMRATCTTQFTTCTTRKRIVSRPVRVVPLAIHPQSH